MSDPIGGVSSPPTTVDAPGNDEPADVAVVDSGVAARVAQARAAQRAGAGLRIDPSDSGYVSFGIETEDGEMVPVLALPKKMNADQLLTLLYAFQEKTGRENVKDSEARVEEKNAEREQKHKETKEKIEKMKRAQEKAKHSSKIGKIFGWIGVALAWVAVGVVAVASGGLAATPLAVAATAMTAMMICQETGATEKAMDAMNLDAKGAMAFQISMAVAMLVVNIIAVGLSFGAASGGAVAATANVAAASAETAETATAGAEVGAAGAEVAATSTETAAASADAGAEVTEVATSAVEVGGEAADGGTGSAEAASSGTEVGTDGAELATSTTEVATDAEETSTSASEEGGNAAEQAAKSTERSRRVVRMANRVRSGVQITQGATQIGGASAQAAAGKQTYDAQIAGADAKQLQVEMLEAQEITSDEIDRIRKLIEQVQTARALVFDTISEAHSTSMKIMPTA